MTECDPSLPFDDQFCGFATVRTALTMANFFGSVADNHLFDAPAIDDTRYTKYANANTNGIGRIEYQCEGGPSLSGMEVRDGDTVRIN